MLASFEIFISKGKRGSHTAYDLIFTVAACYLGLRRYKSKGPNWGRTRILYIGDAEAWRCSRPIVPIEPAGGRGIRGAHAVPLRSMFKARHNLYMESCILCTSTSGYLM